jgi:hypothetical protein
LFASIVAAGVSLAACSSPANEDAGRLELDAGRSFDAGKPDAGNLLADAGRDAGRDPGTDAGSPDDAGGDACADECLCMPCII